jgi:hypothetical protein
MSSKSKSQAQQQSSLSFFDKNPILGNEVTPFTFIIYLFTIGVATFLTISLTVVIFNGLFTSDKTDHPRLLPTDLPEPPEKYDSDGLPLDRLEQFAQYWFVFLLLHPRIATFYSRSCSVGPNISLEMQMKTL